MSGAARLFGCQGAGNAELPHAAKDMDKLAIGGQIAALDSQIDAMVYGLYGLEIKVIEG